MPFSLNTLVRLYRNKLWLRKQTFVKPVSEVVIIIIGGPSNLNIVNYVYHHSPQFKNTNWIHLVRGNGLNVWNVSVNKTDKEP